MKPQVVFGIMSAEQSQETVTQLVDTLKQQPVVIHHDFTKRRAFNIQRPNASLVPESSLTGWGSWGFVKGILLLIQHCLKHVEFDYFQLLSPTCLPLRPLDEYLWHLGQGGADIYLDLFDILSEEEIYMTFAYRAFAPKSSLRHRMLRKARDFYFGSEATLVQRNSLSVLHRNTSNKSVRDHMTKFASLAATQVLAKGWPGTNPYSNHFRPVIGSTWFCASHAVCEKLLLLANDDNIVNFFQRLGNIDEAIFPTLLANSGFRISNSNHAISEFSSDGHPRWITDADLEALFATGRYFGRKFPDDPTSSVRQEVLRRVFTR